MGNTLYCINDDDCVGVKKCKNPDKYKCKDLKCRKKKKDCMTRGNGMEYWGCCVSDECIANINNNTGKAWKWGKCQEKQ